MANRVALLALIGLLALPVAAAKALPLTGTVDARGRVDLTGTLQGQAQVADVVFASNLHNGTAHASLDVADARVQVVNDPMLHWNDQGPINGNGPIPLPEQAQENFTWSGPIAIDTEQSRASIQFYPLQGQTEEMQLNESGPQAIEAPPPVGTWNAVQFASSEPAYPPSAGRLEHENPATQTIQGTFRAFVYGARITFGAGSSARVIHAGQYPHQGLEVTDPYGYTTTGLYDRLTVILTLPSTTIHLQQERAGLWGVLVTRFQGTLNGDVAFSNVASTTVDDRYRNQDLGLVQAIGAFHTQGTYEDQESHWSLDGTATFLGIDGQTIAGQRILDATLIVGGIGLAAWLAVVFSRLLLGGNKQADPLGHPTRVRLVALVSENPGLTRPALMREVGVSQATFTFHARILERAGYLEAYRHGDRLHYVPRTGFIVNEGASAVQRALLACQRHPLRSRILAAFEANPTLDYRHLNALLANGPAPGRTRLQYHLACMERDGILARTGSRRFAQWHLHHHAPPTRSAFDAQEIPSKPATVRPTGAAS